MADNKESVILDVQLDAGKVAEDLGKVTRQMQVLKQEQKLLNQALEEGRISEEDYGKAMAENSSELEKATRQSKGYTAALKQLTSTTGQYGDSLSEQQRKLNDMQKAYDGLDKKYRESKGGKEFLKKIQKQSEAVKKMEQETGRAGRNVGNYTEALKQAGVGVDGFAGKMKAFLSNPWAILIGAIVAAIKGLVDAFKGSEDRMKEMQKAFAPLKAAVDVVKQVFDTLAKSLSGVVMKSIEKVTSGVKWLFGAIDKLGKKLLGKDFGLSKAFEDAAENSKKATEAEQKYIEHRRRMIEAEAKAENEVAKIREQVAQEEKYSVEERTAMLEKAIAIEERVAQDRVKLAKERLAYLEAEAARSENDAQANDDLAQARADVTRAETEFFTKSTALQKQLTALRREDARDAKNAANEQKQQLRDEEKQRKDAEKHTKASLDYQLQIKMAALGEEKKYSKEAFDANMQYFEDLAGVYVKDSTEYLNALTAKEKYQQEWTEKRQEFEEKAQAFIAQYNDFDQLQELYDKELQQLDDFHAAGLVSEQEYQEAKDAIERKYYEKQSKRIASQARELSSAFKSMGDALGEYAEGNEEAAQAQKAFTIMGIALDQAATIADTATAITAAVAGATEAAAAGGPAAPILLAGYIASMVAAVIAAVAGVASSIAQAKQIAQGADAGNFSTGGTIKGTSYTGDKLIAHVNSGEGIYTGTQANNILQEIANNPARGGFDYEAFGAVVAAAVAAQPAPVLVYEEMRDFEKKVATYDEMANI